MHKATRNQPARNREVPTLGQESDVRSSLRSRLLSLTFAGFARTAALLLERLGYENIRLVGRAAANGATSDNEGIGWDMEAVAVSGVNRRKVIVALKQYKPGRLVRRRMVDELRGACLRANASEALLITTSELPLEFARNASAHEYVVPVRVIGGEELLDLCVAHHVGVWKEVADNSSEPAHYGLDEAFFHDVARASSKERRPLSHTVKRVGASSSLSTDVPRRSIKPATITLKLRVWAN